jgi:hypothetical protein
MTNRNDPVIAALVAKLEEANAISSVMVVNGIEEDEAISYEDAKRLVSLIKSIRQAVTDAIYL